MFHENQVNGKISFDHVANLTFVICLLQDIHFSFLRSLWVSLVTCISISLVKHRFSYLALWGGIVCEKATR